MPVTCPNCGFDQNADTAQFCTSCGAPLREPAPPAVDHYLTRRAADRTRTGFLLLTIGFVLYVIPFVNIVGLLLVLVAVILIFIGAEAFGERHKRFVLWSILSFLLVVVALFIVAVVLVFQLVAGELVGRSREELFPLWVAFVAAFGSAVALSAVPYSLISYHLQGELGRRIIGVGVAVAAAVGVGTAWYLYGLFDPFLNAIRGSFDDFASIAGDPVLQYVVPLGNLVWAFVYYLAYQRVARGQVGVPSGAPGGPESPESPFRP